MVLFPINIEILWYFFLLYRKMYQQENIPIWYFFLRKKYHTPLGTFSYWYFFLVFIGNLHIILCSTVPPSILQSSSVPSLILLVQMGTSSHFLVKNDFQHFLVIYFNSFYCWYDCSSISFFSNCFSEHYFLISDIGSYFIRKKKCDSCDQSNDGEKELNQHIIIKHKIAQVDSCEDSDLETPKKPDESQSKIDRVNVKEPEVLPDLSDVTVTVKEV